MAPRSIIRIRIFRCTYSPGVLQPNELVLDFREENRSATRSALLTDWRVQYREAWKSRTKQHQILEELSSLGRRLVQKQGGFGVWAVLCKPSCKLRFFKVASVVISHKCMSMDMPYVHGYVALGFVVGNLCKKYCC